MFIEAGFFTRPKQGVYEMRNKQSQMSAITKKIYIESFKVNKGITSLLEHQLNDPYFLFI